MEQSKIDRINELYRKSKAEGLTEAEKKEQTLLRKEFVADVKKNLTAQLNNIDIQNEGWNDPKTLVKNMEINQRNFRKEHLAIRNAMLPGEVAEKKQRHCKASAANRNGIKIRKKFLLIIR